MKNILSKIITTFKKRKKTTAIGFLILLVFIWALFLRSGQKQQGYQTAKAERGTLIVSVSSSGQVSSANESPVNTQLSGTVKNIYANNGDEVKAGGPILDLALDPQSQQKQSQAWSSYLQAKTNLDSANANLYTLQQQLFTYNQKFMNGAVASNLPTYDPVYIEQNADWLAAEAKYKNQQTVIEQAQAALNNAWLTYSQSSGTITAPMAGKVSGLALKSGSIIPPITTSSSTTTSVQKVATIKTDIPPSISFSLSEVDVPKIKVGQKATVTFDALPNTYTGKITSLDTGGAVISGVTTYPVTITLDTVSPEIYPNMSATANIITQIKDNVILVPNGALQIQSGQSMVRVMKNGVVQETPVQVGASSDTQTEITNGLAEGDEIVTSFILGNSQGNTTSPFSSSPFGGSGARGGNVRMITR